jgi:hypothetical protein
MSGLCGLASCCWPSAVGLALLNISFRSTIRLSKRASWPRSLMSPAVLRIDVHRRGSFDPCVATPVGFTFQVGAQARKYRCAWLHRDVRILSASTVQAFGGLLRLLCPLLTSPPRSRALRPAQSELSDTAEISRGKTDRLRRTPAGFTTPALDGRTCPLVRPGRPRYPVLVHRAAALFYASFRLRLATTLLRFANPSPPGRGLSPPSCRSCSAHTENRDLGAPVA